MNPNKVSEYVYKQPKLSLEKRAIGELLYCIIAKERPPIATEAIIDAIDTDELESPLNIIVGMFQRASSLYTGIEVIMTSLPTLLANELSNSRGRNPNKPIYKHLKEVPTLKETEAKQAELLPATATIVEEDVADVADKGLTAKEIDSMSDAQITQYLERFAGD